MENAFGEPQTIVLLGGTSEIGQAIVRRLAGPSVRTVVLACRHPASVDDFAASVRAAGTDVDVVPFDATEHHRHAALVADLAARHGDLDVVVLGFGVLGEASALADDPVAAAAAAEVNYVGSVSVGLAVAAQLRAQGHGRLVVLSSVAGERVRKANFVYGSTKAGVDGFAQGLGDWLEGSGASVLIVRPGFVRTKMTTGMAAAPFATSASAVADAVADGLRRRRRIVWVPPLLRWVFVVFRHLPARVWRRLPG